MTNEELYKLAQEVEPKDHILSILIQVLACMWEGGLEQEYLAHTKQFTGAIVTGIKYMEWINRG